MERDQGRTMSPSHAIQAHLGGTQREVAERLGLTVQAWNRYLKGRACPSVVAVQRWCKAAGVSLVCDGDGWRVRRGRRSR
jgi:transcriptional regulator with XRE-family HTH domain